MIGDFDNRKKGLTHYIFENIDKSIFDIFYICYPSRDYELWRELYNKKFELFGFKTYLIPQYKLLKRIISIKRILDFEKPDIIFSAVTDIEPFLLKKIKGIPLVDSVHGMPRNLNLSILLKGSIRGSGLTSFVVSKIKNLADYIVVVSKAVKDGVIKNGIKIEKIKLIYNGVDIEYIKKRSSERLEEIDIFSSGNPIILSVGRLSPEKGHKYLIEAFNLIKDKTDAKLVIIGWGPEENYLKELVQKYSLKNKIYFLGFRENPFKYMVRSTFLVLPSVSEAFPSVLIEAAVCGLPIIATDCGGPREILDIVKHGILVPKGDIEKLAEAIIRLLSNDELLRMLSANALNNARKFDIKKTAKEYEKLWLDCLN